MKQDRKPSKIILQRATARRIEGARRPLTVTRNRIGPAPSSSTAVIVPFPLIKNAAVVAQVVAALPHVYAPELNKRRDQELYRIRGELVRNGVKSADAWLCARQVVHAAYIERVTQAHKEAGVL